jgi:hypothetical protein
LSGIKGTAVTCFGSDAQQRWLCRASVRLLWDTTRPALLNGGRPALLHPLDLIRPFLGRIALQLFLIKAARVLTQIQRVDQNRAEESDDDDEEDDDSFSGALLLC